MEEGGGERHTQLPNNSNLKIKSALMAQEYQQNYNQAGLRELPSSQLQVAACIRILRHTHTHTRAHTYNNQHTIIFKHIRTFRVRIGLPRTHECSK